MSDLISRRAAIDVIDKEQKEIDVSDVSAMYAYSKCKTIIKQLPSVLGTNLAEVGTDCISRQAAITQLSHNKNKGDDEWELAVENDIRTIWKLPSAQPEIILCKDCKHWIPYDWMFSEVWQSRNMADYPEDDIGCNLCDMAMKANDFCSRGERREVNHESN